MKVQFPCIYHVLFFNMCVHLFHDSTHLRIILSLKPSKVFIVSSWFGSLFTSCFSPLIMDDKASFLASFLDSFFNSSSVNSFKNLGTISWNKNKRKRHQLTINCHTYMYIYVAIKYFLQLPSHVIHLISALENFQWGNKPCSDNTKN